MRPHFTSSDFFYGAVLHKDLPSKNPKFGNDRGVHPEWPGRVTDPSARTGALLRDSMHSHFVILEAHQPALVNRVSFLYL